MDVVMDSVVGSENFGPAVFLAVFVGLGVIIFTFLVKWIKQGQAEQEDENDDKLDRAKNFPADASGKHRKKESTHTVKGLSKKKLSDRESRRTARANEKGYNHPWLLATLKGHSGRVLDMDYSANGKYLVSCADEDPDPGGMAPSKHCPPFSSSEGFPSSSESTKESSSSSSSTPSPLMIKRLSRRQRKNRKMADGAFVQTRIAAPSAKLKNEKYNEPSNKNAPKNEEKKEKGSKPQKNKNNGSKSVFNDKIPMMTFSVNTFARILKEKYLLRKEDMAMLNYPLRPERDLYERDIQHDHSTDNRKHHRLDVNAVEFVPRSESVDSGNGSSSSSDEENSGSEAGEDLVAPPQLAPGTIKLKDVRTRTCTRCGQFFSTTSKKYITLDKCFYHIGKIETRHRNSYGLIQYSCCKGSNMSLGCASADLHVWNGPAEPIVNSSFVETEPPSVKREDNNYGVYSLDCEMSFTVSGLEVVKITLVDVRGQPVYNEYVKPVNEVVDFNTKYSGVTKEHFEKHSPKSLVQVQRDLKKFICNETVLIGHALENDLKVLKMLHKTVVDTSFVFPHMRGLPYRRSLKDLAAACLRKDIQCGKNGHDSFEDARTCMELMLSRVSKDFPYL